MLPGNLGFPLYDKIRGSEMKKLLSLATAGIIGTATLCSTAQAGQLTFHNWDAWELVEDVWGGALFGLLVPDPVAPVEGWVAATSIGGSSFLGALGGWHDRR